MYTPTLKAMKTLSQDDYRYCPLKKDIFSDLMTPIMVLKKLKSVSEHCFILESNEDASHWGRYTFLGFDPKTEITCAKGSLYVDKKVKVGNPTDYIRQILKENRSAKPQGFPSLTGGLVGFFAYDYLQYSEPALHLDAKDDEYFKDIDLMLFDEMICFDHDKQKIMIIVNVDLQYLEQDYLRKTKRIEEIERLLKMDYLEISDPLRLKSPFTPLFSKQEYCDMVEKGKHYIKEGDIFQVVLSNRIEAKCSGSLLDTYRILRTTNPSPYMFYFSSSDLEVAGASPETLVKLEGQTLYTFPIAGSRRRGKDDEEDDMLVKDLLSDEKELAEHNMLVDLGRNDLGKISRFNSVKVVKYKDVLKFSKVIHIASEVQSILREDKDALDAIETLLPAGTLSGAPKIRACEIINKLENNKRGIYGGAIGYLDFGGDMDTCIGIRLAYKKRGKVFIRSGAGIVYDSVPESEYQECLNKAGAVIEALRQADGGIEE